MKKILLFLVALATTLTSSAQIQRMVVIEEYTGTGCGYCPRGLAGMDLLKATYEDKCIGIALHQYNSDDPMYITKYARLSFQGAPECTVNRLQYTDPYYGDNYGSGSIKDEVDDWAAISVHAGVESISAVYQDDNQKKVDIKATLNFDADGDYSVAFVLTADSLTSDASSWKQHNYYYSYSPSGDPLMDQFCSGGENGASTFYWKFNDVAISSSYNTSGENLAESLAPAEAGVAQEVSYTLNLPTKTQILKAIRKELVFGIVLIIDNTSGEIVNAARAHVVPAPDPTGIVSATTDAIPVAFYNAEGKTIATPQKGMNIVKMSDGTVKKVMY